MKRNVEGLKHYHVSRNGKLYSDWSGSWKEVQPAIKNTGYVSNNLRGEGGIHKNCYRHRLVAEAYIPNPDNLPCVCHKDNNPQNNRVSNLYWGTQKDNIEQCIKDGNFYYVGIMRKRKVYVDILIKDYQSGMPRKESLLKHGISTHVYYKILKEANML